MNGPSCTVYRVCAVVSYHEGKPKPTAARFYETEPAATMATSDATSTAKLKAESKVPAQEAGGRYKFKTMAWIFVEASGCGWTARDSIPAPRSSERRVQELLRSCPGFCGVLLHGVEQLVEGI